MNRPKTTSKAKPAAGVLRRRHRDRHLPESAAAPPPELPPEKIAVQLPLSPHGIVRYDDFAPLFGITFSRSHVWRMAQRGQFPLPIQLSDNAIGWRVRDIEAWLESRPAGPGRPDLQPPAARP